MPVVRSTETRRTETPNAVMTTLASPTLGGAARSLWRVDMPPGAQGPAHVFDVEQVWTVLSGSGTVEIDGAADALEAGDTVVLRPGVPRRLTADSATGMSAVVTRRRRRARGAARRHRPQGARVDRLTRPAPRHIGCPLLSRAIRHR